MSDCHNKKAYEDYVLKADKMTTDYNHKSESAWRDYCNNFYDFAAYEAKRKELELTYSPQLKKFWKEYEKERVPCSCGEC